jgi:hypothetical protein
VQLGRVSGDKFEPVFRLDSWTRGLYFHDHLAFVGTSRVLPRYSHYAPGLDPDQCRTGVHVLDLVTGRMLVSLLCPMGNQIFAIEGIDHRITPGFPFVQGSNPSPKSRSQLFSRGLAA